MLDVGTDAPSFALNDQHGDIVRSESLRGNWVVMWWYPKASTAG